MALNKQVAVVTGAGSGIGRASALALLREGYAVVLAGRHMESLIETSKTEPGLAAQALPVPTDVGNPESVKALFAKTYETFGRVDLLFNNAGTGSPPTPFQELSFEQWKAVLDTNLTGSFLCSQEAFKIMINQTLWVAELSITVLSQPTSHDQIRLHIPQQNTQLQV